MRLVQLRVVKCMFCCCVVVVVVFSGKLKIKIFSGSNEESIQRRINTSHVRPAACAVGYLYSGLGRRCFTRLRGKQVSSSGSVMVGMPSVSFLC